jgi:hypothetical protein
MGTLPLHLAETDIVQQKMKEKKEGKIMTNATVRDINPLSKYLVASNPKVLLFLKIDQ